MEAVNDNKMVSTVDDDEIAHFKKLSWRWWGKKTALHTMNSIRVPFIQKGLSKFSSDTSKPFGNKLVLEVGCGGGILTEALAELGGITMHGIDPSPEAIAAAKRHASLNSQLSNVTYSNESIEQHALDNYEKYDAVVASEVLEHITEKEMFLEFCVKCLKPGGSIFITTFNKTFRSRIMSIIVIQEILNVIPRGTHQWDKFISPEDVSNILQKFNCKTVEVSGIDLNFVTKNWSWSNNISTNYTLHAIK